MLAMQVQFLVRELRSQMSRGQKTKLWDRRNIVINSVKTLTWSISKISFKKVLGFPGGLMVKNPSTNAGDTGLILGLGRSTEPVYHNYWACALEPGSHNYWAQVLQLLKPTHPRVHALQQEKPLQWEAHARPLESSLCSPLEKSQEQRRPSTTIFFFLKIATIKIS